MSLVDYGHRGVPNVLLTATLQSDGAWNAAHFENSEYDKLVNQYVAALDPRPRARWPGRSKPCAGGDPVILPYWFDAISICKAAIGGVVTTGMGQIFLSGAGPAAT